MSPTVSPLTDAVLATGTTLSAKTTLVTQPTLVTEPTLTASVPLVAETILQLDLFGPNTLPLLLVLAGLVLSIMEALAPGANFVVVGVALLAAGLLGLVLGPVMGPFGLGIAVLVFGAIALYVYRDLGLYETSGQQTKDSGDLKGRSARVTERVTPTEGEVKVEDGGFNPYFSARSLDGEIEEGTEVIVVDPGGGNVLTVSPFADDVSAIDRELARGRETDDEDDRERERN